MTNYIEEMMRTAGVEKIENEVPALDKDGLPSNFYVNYVWDYPAFTAEKQLEIIKLICLSKYKFSMDIKNKKYYLFATLYRFMYQGEQIEIQNSDFAQALAQLTTGLMKARELDKEIVKEILQ